MYPGSDKESYVKPFLLRSLTLYRFRKGLQRQCLMGSAVAGINHARTITKASATDLDARQDDHNKGICSPGSLVKNSVR